MYWSLSLLLLLSLLFAEITCSGFLHIRLKSQYRQEAKLLVGPQDKLSSIVVPIRLHSGTTRELGPFPIEFNEKYTMTINGGGVGELGINGSTYTAEFEPTRGTLAPIQLLLPLNGLELIFECDDGWSGSKCDVRCSNDCTTDRVNETMTVSTDYSIDMTKLPEMVNRLKKTTEVENDIRREENEKDVLEASNPSDTPVTIYLPPPKKRVENQKDVLEASKSKDSRESINHDMLSSLLNSKVTIRREENEKDVLEASNPDDSSVKIYLKPKKRDENQKDSVGATKPTDFSFTLMDLLNSKLTIDESIDKLPMHMELETYGVDDKGPLNGMLRFSSEGQKTFVLDGPAKSLLPLFQPLMVDLLAAGPSDDFALNQKLRDFLNE